MNYLTVTIPAGETESNTLSAPTANMNFIALETTEFEAGDISFEIIGQDSITYKPILGVSGDAVSITAVAENSFYKLLPDDFYGLGGIRLKSSVEQTAGATLYLYYK